MAGLRWCNIIDARRCANARMTTVAMIAVSAIGVFFGSGPAECSGRGGARLAARSTGLRLAKRCDQRGDRSRGRAWACLIAIGFVILLLPSSLTALGGYRDAGARRLRRRCSSPARSVSCLHRGSLLPLARWRYSRWIATLAVDARRVLLGPHGPTILATWMPHPRAHHRRHLVAWAARRVSLLPVADAAVLFTVMVGVALVPISIGGWGLRELAVVSLLGHHGVAPERRCCFRCASASPSPSASLPRAVAWLLYSFAPSRHSVKRGR